MEGGGSHPDGRAADVVEADGSRILDWAENDKATLTAGA